MDKKTFYAQLSEKLSELGVSNEYIQSHIAQFDSYFSGKSEEETEKEISKLGSIDRVAQRIKRMTEKLIIDEQREAITQKHVTSAKIKPSENKIKVNVNSERKLHVTENAIDNTQNKQKAVTGEFQPLIIDKDIPQNPPKKIGKNEQSKIDELSVNPLTPKKDEINVNEQQEIKDIENIDDSSYPMPDAETIKNNKRKFWIIFSLALPITIAICLAVSFLFVSAFFLIAVLIIVAVATLIAMTAVGTLTSVSGLIFGIAKMFSCVPIGLYECGLSIVIGSVALFIGIFIYNFAVRLMPFTAKWLLVFAKFVIKKSKELFIYLKKECIGG